MKKSQIILGVGIAGLVIVMMMWLALRPQPVSVPYKESVTADGGLIQRPVRAASTLNGTIVSPLTFAAGVSGTVTVTQGYVVGLSAVATQADGGVASVTITPNGPNVTDGSAVTQPSILIPPGDSWSLGRPVIQGSPNEMGVGTVIVFANTDAYTVVISLGGS